MLPILRGTFFGLLVLGISAFAAPALGIVWGASFIGAAILCLLIGVIPWERGHAAPRALRVPAQPRPQGPNGLVTWASGHGWLIAGVILFALAAATIFFGFGPDNRSNHLIATAILAVAGVVCFMIEADVFGTYLTPFLQGLWLLASFLAGYLVIEAAHEAELSAGNFPYAIYLLLCAVSAIMAICAMTGHLGAAIGATGKGFGWLIATFFQSLFGGSGPQLAYFLWFLICGTLLVLGYQSQDGEFLYFLDAEPRTVKLLLIGFGMGAIAAFIVLVFSLIGGAARRNRP
jgi:hypothetical protein